MNQVLLDPAGRGLTRLAGGMQLLGWPRSCEEFERYVQAWLLERSVAAAALLLGEWSTRILGLDLYIISGHRTPQQQQALIVRGDTTAVSPATSCHVRCPSTAFDVGYAFAASRDQIQLLAQRARELGLRAGSQFRVPSPNHYDAGACG